MWCILDNFNVVCNMDERRGVNEKASSSQVLEMNFFNNFLREVELEDLNVLGRCYTWYHPNGIAMSMIDRMLISEEWTHYWEGFPFGCFREMCRIVNHWF